QEFGYSWPPPRFWFVFDIAPPTVTLRSVIATVDPLIGATAVHVMFYSHDDADRYAMSGQFPRDAALHDLTAGANLTAVVVMTPVCAALPRHQAVNVHVRFVSPTGPAQLDIADTPDLLLDDIMSGGACGQGSES